MFLKSKAPVVPENAPIIIEKERFSLRAYRVGKLLVFKAKKRRTAMARAYRKRSKKASPQGPEVVDKADVLADRVRVELPVSVAEVVEGVSDELERLSGEAGLLIMNTVMQGEVEALAVREPQPRHARVPLLQSGRTSRQGL